VLALVSASLVVDEALDETTPLEEIGLSARSEGMRSERTEMRRMERFISKRFFLAGNHKASPYDS
jgi:hypothetical protein